nr:hypothetical protein [Leucobacter coleopterorum]
MGAPENKLVPRHILLLLINDRRTVTSSAVLVDRQRHQRVGGAREQQISCDEVGVGSLRKLLIEAQLMPLNQLAAQKNCATWGLQTIGFPCQIHLVRFVAVEPKIEGVRQRVTVGVFECNPPREHLSLGKLSGRARDKREVIGASQSSGSGHEIHSPRAESSPTFRAEATPPFGFEMRRTA